MFPAGFNRSPVQLSLMAALVLGLLVWSRSDAQAQTADNVVYISGVNGADPRTGEYADNIGSQVRQVFANLRAELRSANRTIDDVASVNVYLTDTRHFSAMNELYREVFHTDPPTRATVQVDLPSPDALIELSVVAVDPNVGRTVVRPSTIKSPELPYSWGIKSGNTLYIAGATSRNPETYQPVTGDVTAQTRRVLENIGLVLDAADMDYSDVVACRVFLDDARRFGAMNRVYVTFFPDVPPARATVRAGVMNPAFKVEIQCVAVQDASRRAVVAEGARAGRNFSPSILVGNRQYLSGMLGRGPEGYGSIESQTRLTLQNLFATLRAAELEPSHVINARLYLTDIRNARTVLEVYGEMMGDASPPATVVGAPLMSATAGVEIMFTAQRN